MNLHAFSYIEIIKITPLTTTIIKKLIYTFMEITLVIYLKVRPLSLCTIQIITIIPIINMYFLHCIYVHLQPKCKCTTIESRYFQPMEMNFELNSNTSIDINAIQVEVHLPPIWKM
jgi:hypothetical protein